MDDKDTVVTAKLLDMSSMIIPVTPLIQHLNSLEQRRLLLQVL
jgi:hypothetical protein